MNLQPLLLLLLLSSLQGLATSRIFFYIVFLLFLSQYHFNVQYKKITYITIGVTNLFLDHDCIPEVESHLPDVHKRMLVRQHLVQRVQLHQGQPHEVNQSPRRG